MKSKNSSPLKIVVNGAAGRMGRRLLALASADENFQIVGAREHQDHNLLGKFVRDFVPEVSDGNLKLTADFPDEVDVIIDFSRPASAVDCAKKAMQNRCALVSGTTGLSEDQFNAIVEAQKIVPVIQSANYSVGVNLMVKIVGEMAKALGEDFDIEIVETHHNKKIDAPSGTAFSLASEICRETGRDMLKDLVNGRSGILEKRTKTEIGLHAIRLGSVIGDHTVYFGSEFERLEITHRASSRDVFASGALRAAAFIAKKSPGFYSMQNVLGKIKN